MNLLNDNCPEIDRKLLDYVALLKKWNSTINLVSRETIEDVWTRHIEDCSQLAKAISVDAKTLVDLGSGAGLPGLILAILLPIHITLVERDQRKCAFLIEATRQLNLPNVTVKNKEIVSITEIYDVITARALAPLEQLCTMAYPLCSSDTICLFPKGKNFATEIGAAEKNWSFEYDTTPSKTNVDAVILILSKLMPRA